MPEIVDRAAGRAVEHGEFRRLFGGGHQSRLAWRIRLAGRPPGKLSVASVASTASAGSVAVSSAMTMMPLSRAFFDRLQDAGRFTWA